MNRLLALCATAFVIVGCSHVAGPTPVTVPLPENQGTYALTGTVVSDEGEAILAGVKVDVSDGIGHRATFTDADGHFSVDALGAGTWTVSVTKPGYDPQVVRVNLSGDMRMDFRLERADRIDRPGRQGRLNRG